MDGGHGPVLDKQDARAGETSGRMRIVLLTSICLVVLIFAGLLVSWA